MPKSVVVAAMQGCDTPDEYERFDIPIVDSNFRKLFRLSISASINFCFFKTKVWKLTLKPQKKIDKEIPLSVFQKAVHFCLSATITLRFSAPISVGLIWVS